MAYKRIKGGEKNELSGVPFTKKELEKVADLYIEMNGQGIHENNPKIHVLANKLNRTIRSVENQLLGFRSFVTGKSGRKNFNSWIPEVWEEKNARQENNHNNLTVVQPEKEVFDEFKFRISSQLKTILGKNLITDDFVAVFELVKNSYDAHAKRVDIIFEDDKIIIRDNGKGMNRQDIIDKWLFIAYSAKNEGVEDVEFENNISFRDQINVNRIYAGAKGIGRFSADRLGSRLDLITRKINDPILWHLGFDWGKYENDAEDEFKDIDVFAEELQFTNHPDFNHGLILEISSLRNIWPRHKILDLKRSLEKLINPFTIENDFQIEIICEREARKDLEIKGQIDYNPRSIVNSEIKNFVFEALNINTTQIKVSIATDESTIETELIDRGNLIFRISESNPYKYLPDNSNIHLFYLNQGAKFNFTRLMGVRTFDFGSIFLFNNGFRVLPFGEPNNDPFNINRRKAQGHARFLGTRDLIGQITISKSSEQFQETSNREGGLIETPGTIELEDFFMETLKKLESFVEPILWKIKGRTGEKEEILDLTAQSQIIDFVARISGQKNIILLDYSDKLLDYISENISESNIPLFDTLRLIAEKAGDIDSLSIIDNEESRYVQEIEKRKEEERKRIEAEEKAEAEEKRRIEAEEKAAEEERKRIEAEEAARIALIDLDKKSEQLSIRDSIDSQDIENVTNLHHQVFVISDTISTILKEIYNKVSIDKQIDYAELAQFIDELSLENNKIESLSRFGMRAIFEDFNSINKNDITDFIDDYVEKISNFFKTNKINVFYKSLDNTKFKTRFRPLDVSIIIDNMINNSKKHKASKLIISTQTKGDIFEVIFEDDGVGLDKDILDSSQIFKQGFSTTKSTGLGLYHIQNIINDYKWEITFDSTIKKGAKFIIKISK